MCSGISNALCDLILLLPCALQAVCDCVSQIRRVRIARYVLYIFLCVCVYVHTHTHAHSAQERVSIATIFGEQQEVNAYRLLYVC